MRRLSSSLIAVTMVVSSLVGGMPTARAGTTDDAFYVSLGDSLAVGYQPGPGGNGEGYVDDLWRSVRETIPTLQMQKFSCVGETSRSMITGNRSNCTYDEGSQLDAAVAFLDSHVGQVPFITIDIGANDLLFRCFSREGLLHRPCVMDLVPRVGDRLTRIIDALRAAGPDVPILGMTYYNPFLGFWGLIPHGRVLAKVAARGWTVLNIGLTTAYEGAGAVVADVATTFRIDDFSDTVLVPGRGRLPLNVAVACRWTWFCSPRYAGDPHANAIGYRKVAHTFDLELQPLLLARTLKAGS
ncbi:MAG: SGNH/GDSL hydrolase family protein [Actinomycetota bacterium]